MFVLLVQFKNLVNTGSYFVHVFETFTVNLCINSNFLAQIALKNNRFLILENGTW